MSALVNGIPASFGIAMGRVKRLEAEAPAAQAVKIEPAQAEAEAERLTAAVERASAELEEIRRRLLEGKQEHEAEIFEAHLLLLEDEELIGAAKDKIANDHYSAESAMAESANEVAAVIASLDDPYLRERAADIQDISRRVIRILRGEEKEDTSDSDADGERKILIAEDLTPSDTAQLDTSEVAGFATAAGGSTSHSAIIARSVGIPAVVGAGAELLQVHNGQFAILDGTQGLLLIDPDESTIAEYREKQASAEKRRATLEAYRSGPSVSSDGAKVELVANIGSVADAAAAKTQGAEGVGLFRTEFLYMGRKTLPTEEEQFEAYRAVSEAFGKDAPIVIRTMDIGGDKELASLQLDKEDNPFLGYRAIRICLDMPDMFRTQLRAILRASAFGNVKIMFPMIATLAEWRQAKTMLEQAKAELAAEGISFNEKMETGIMIEIPAAALMADRFAKEADFFSIGTNDLVQYTLAADRMNPKLRKLTNPLHPPVLRLIDRVIQAAHREGKWTGMCGEMAGQPLALPILLGMGLDEFSMSGSSVAQARWLLSKLSRSRLRETASAVLELDDASDVKRYVEEHVPEISDILA